MMYLMVAHVPVWSLSKRHHLPHDNTKAPHITGRGEFPVCYGLWCCPTNGNLSSLQNKIKADYITKIKEPFYSICRTLLYLCASTINWSQDIKHHYKSSLHLWYRCLQDSLPTHGIVRSLTLCTPGYYLQGCCVQQDLCVHSSYLTDTSSLLQCH